MATKARGGFCVLEEAGLSHEWEEHVQGAPESVDLTLVELHLGKPAVSGGVLEIRHGWTSSRVATVHLGARAFCVVDSRESIVSSTLSMISGRLDWKSWGGQPGRDPTFRSKSIEPH